MEKREGKMEETIIQKLFYAMSYIISSIIRLFISFIWTGIIETSKDISSCLLVI